MVYLNKKVRKTYLQPETLLKVFVNTNHNNLQVGFELEQTQNHLLDKQ